jgi:CRISPR-associated endonuclease Cas1
MPYVQPLDFRLRVKMAKRPFDLLITDRNPIVFVEHAKIRIKRGCLTAISKNKESGDIMERVIPCGSTMLMFLGTGVSISSDAARLAGLHGMHIGFVRGGCNVHSYWMSGRWSDPSRITKQCLARENPMMRLRIAKQFILKRLKKESAPDELFSLVEDATSIESLLGLEAFWAKRVYVKLSQEFQHPFKRDQSSHLGVNGALSLLNNALYSITTSVIIHCGFHPSIGFLHGKTRRGGLSFDLADLFKYQLTLVPAFSSLKYDNKALMYQLNEKLLENHGAVIKEMVQICDWILGERSWH